jgi:modification methylase
VFVPLRFTYLTDARQLPQLAPAAARGKVALVVTSPPYGPSVHGQVRAEAGGVRKYDNRYSRDPVNLAYHGVDALLDGITRILDGTARLLKPGGVVVVTARPWRHRGELVDLPSAVIAAGRAAGLTPVERCVALLAGLDSGHLVPRPSFFQLDNTRKARARRRALAPDHPRGRADLPSQALSRRFARTQGCSGRTQGCSTAIGPC